MPWIGQSTWRASRAISGLARGRRPKKVTGTPRAVVLVDQHGDVRAALQRFEQALIGASMLVGTSVPMQPARMPITASEMAGDVRPAIEHGGVDAVACGADRGELPVRQMRGEDQRRLAVVAQPDRDPLALVGIHDAARARARGS